MAIELVQISSQCKFISGESDKKKEFHSQMILLISKHEYEWHQFEAPGI